MFLKKDLSAILLTGYGKCLVYQVIPSLLKERGSNSLSVVIVVSCLNALMRDQIVKLRANGVETAVLCTSQCKPPHPPGRDIAGHLRGIFRYLTSERAAGIGDFDLFCTSSKNSGGVDRGIFHRGGLGQDSLVQQGGGNRR